MSKFTCSARIDNASERRALLAWVKTIANEGYSEKDNIVSMTYHDNLPIFAKDNKRYSILCVFSQFTPHSITVKA